MLRINSGGVHLIFDIFFLGGGRLFKGGVYTREAFFTNLNTKIINYSYHLLYKKIEKIFHNHVKKLREIGKKWKYLLLGDNAITSQNYVTWI